MKNNVMSYFLIIGAAFCWGMGGVFTKIITPYGYTSMEMAFLKTLVGFIILSIAVLKNRDIIKLSSRKDLINLCIISIFGYSLYAVAFIKTVNEIGVGIAGAMLYTKCMFVLIFSRILFGDIITFKKALAIFLTLMGCVFISGIFSQGEVHFTIKGFAWGIFSGIGFAIYDVVGKQTLERNSSQTVNFYTFLISTVFIGILANPVTAVARVFETNTFPLIIAYGIMISALPYILYVLGLSRVDVSVAAVVSTFELLTAITAGAVLYNESLTVFKVIGIICIISAVCILNLSGKKTNAQS